MLTENQKQFVSFVEEKFGSEYIISRKEILSITNELGIKYPQWVQLYKISHGKFKMPSLNKSSVENVVSAKKLFHKETSSLIPEKDPNFEKFGFYNDLKSILKSRMFFPVFISGHSGTGKTHMVLQACAELKRECIRVNFSIETDENCLLGGPTLVNGNIIQTEGPVITCLRKGSVLILDELDRANQNNLLILNGILEGKGYFNPRTGEYIKASEGFNVIATANTKGYGSEDGKYLSQIMDSAFLERFFVTFEQTFPSEKVEKKILLSYTDDVDFIDKLVKWSSVIRKTFESGGIDELISTRRLIQIVQTYNIFKNKLKTIELCVSRYDSQIKESFLDLYCKLDENILKFDSEGNLIEKVSETPVDDIAF